MSSEIDSLQVSPHHVAGALASLLQEFSQRAQAAIDHIPPMIRPMIEPLLQGGALQDTDGEMARHLWLYLTREVLRDGNGSA